MAQTLNVKNGDGEKSEKSTQSFTKGHRRAHSMPQAQRNTRNLHENIKKQENSGKKDDSKRAVHFRHILVPADTRRLQAQRGSPDFDVIEVMPDEQDFEVPIDEEEMMRFQGIEHSEETINDVHKRHKRFWQLNWKGVHFTGLPDWLQDNEFLHSGHRPQLGTFSSCFKSVFSLHTETGNIWTHIYGCVAFTGAFVWLISRPANVVAWPDKVIFLIFCICAVLCMGLSFSFHIVQCHSENVGRLFSKLDYSGISLLIIGSFVPWIYYAFYCRAFAMSFYIGMIVVLGIAAVIVSLWDKFAQPKFRPLRGGVFLAMGLSSIVPALHLAITDGFKWMFEYASFHWLLLMGFLYIFGAAIYMVRFPERCCPGKCDILCHSHQLFHIFVIFAAAVHYHGMLEMAMKRLEGGSCSEQLIEHNGTDEAQILWIDEQLRPY